MGNLSGILLAADFDNTMTANDGSFPQRNADALAHFTAEGGLFTLATGRSHAAVSELVTRFPINAPVIETNGTCIYDFRAGKVLYSNPLAPSILPLMQEVLSRFPSVAVECHTVDAVFVEQPNDATAFHEGRVGMRFPRRPLAEVPMPWLKNLVTGDHDVLLDVQRFLLEQAGDTLEVVFSLDRFLEVFRKGSSKGAALRTLEQLLGLEHGKVCAVGDGDNDISMLAAAGKSFACGNATPAAKRAAMYTVCHCNDGAVADVVEWIEQNL